MNVQNQWKRLFIGGAVAVTLTAGALWAVDNVSAASPTALLRQVGIQQMAGFGEHGEHGGRGGRGGPDGAGAFGGPGSFGGPGMMKPGHEAMGEQQQYLADALGITMADLQTAHESVRTTLLDQAVADGTLTQEQADQIKAGERIQIPGVRMQRDAPKSVDHEALLASALGITVEELEAAQVTAHETALAAAVANGTITQEQVDRMAAHQAFRSYVEETYGTARPTATMAELIQGAVDAGAITQAQADLLSSGGMERMGPGGRGDFEGRGPRGRGDFEGRGPRGRELPQDGGSETQPNLDSNDAVDGSNA